MIKHRENFIFYLYLALNSAEAGCHRWDENLISSLGQNGICLDKVAPKLIQFHSFKRKTKFVKSFIFWDVTPCSPLKETASVV
jgi:hypothetical protein